jgi:fatty-acyl-CoA synthase
MLPTTMPPQSGHHSIAESLGRHGGALTFVDGSGSATRLSGPELLEHATAAAVRLGQLGVRPTDRVCLLAPTSTATLVTLFGLWRLGAVPVVVAETQRTDPHGVPARLSHRVAAAGAVAVVTDPDLRDSLDGRLGVPVVTTRDLQEPGAPGRSPAVPEPDQLGLLQFTSGTTEASRAVPVTQGQIVDNVRWVAQAAGLGRGTTHASWLPLYHDMGIISLAGMLADGRNVVTMATEAFVRRPAAWLETVAAYHADSTAAPNVAYALAARSQQLRPRSLDLSRLAVAFNGAEPVTAEVVEQALRTFEDCGLRPEAMCPTYGLAEATLAVTTAEGTEPARFLSPAEVSVPAGADRPHRPVASCGRPIAGTSLAVSDERGNRLPEGAVGEILVSGPGVMPGYWAGAGDRPAGQGRPAGVVDGWLHTGDLGFVRGGELYVCGRTKDMIIVGGRNFYPEDYEAEVERARGVRTGNAIAFSLAASERMVVVAECRGAPDVCASVGRELLERFRVHFDHAPEEIVLVRPGTLPKTSSGKRQRGRCRELYLAGELTTVHTVH